MTKTSETECELKKILKDKKGQSEQLKKSLVKTRNAIRKKYRDLHNQNLVLSERVHKIFQPIIGPLGTLVVQTKKKTTTTLEWSTKKS